MNRYMYIEHDVEHDIPAGVKVVRSNMRTTMNHLFGS